MPWPWGMDIWNGKRRGRKKRHIYDQNFFLQFKDSLLDVLGQILTPKISKKSSNQQKPIRVVRSWKWRDMVPCTRTPGHTRLLGQETWSYPWRTWRALLEKTPSQGDTETAMQNTRGLMSWLLGVFLPMKQRRPRRGITGSFYTFQRHRIHQSSCSLNLLVLKWKLLACHMLYMGWRSSHRPLGLLEVPYSCFLQVT